MLGKRVIGKSSEKGLMRSQSGDRKRGENVENIHLGEASVSMTLTTTEHVPEEVEQLDLPAGVRLSVFAASQDRYNPHAIIQESLGNDHTLPPHNS